MYVKPIVSFSCTSSLTPFPHQTMYKTATNATPRVYVCVPGRADICVDISVVSSTADTGTENFVSQMTSYVSSGTSDSAYTEHLESAAVVSEAYC